jgi:hypothetical protein
VGQAYKLCSFFVRSSKYGAENTDSAIADHDRYEKRSDWVTAGEFKHGVS